MRATTAPQIPTTLLHGCVGVDCVIVHGIISNTHQQHASATRTRSRKRRIDRLRCTASLRRCNEKAPLCMRALRAALSTSREVYSGIFCDGKTIVSQIPAMAPVLSKTEKGK
jgi:hypothetical protein